LRLDLLCAFIDDAKEPGKAIESVKLALDLPRSTDHKTLRAIALELRERAYSAEADYIMDLAVRAKSSEDLNNLQAAFGRYVVDRARLADVERA
jgi:hypothetical protein